MSKHERKINLKSDRKIEKKDIMPIVNAEEQEIFYVARSNGFIAAKAKLQDIEVDVSRSFIAYIQHENVNITTLQLFNFYATLVAISLTISLLLKNALFFSSIVIVIFDAVLGKSFAKYMINAYHWQKDEALKKQKPWLTAAIMTQNAYKKLGRVPSMEEIRKESMFVQNNKQELPIFCSIISLILLGLSTSSVIETSFKVYLIRGTIIYICVAILLNFLTWKFIGWYKVKKPNNEQLKVAREAIKEYDKMVQEVNKDPDKKIREILDEDLTVIHMYYDTIYLTSTKC